MSPIILPIQNQSSILDIYMSKLLSALKHNNLNIKDMARVLCDVIIKCDNESIIEPEKICEQIKNRFFGEFNIEVKI